MSPDEGVSYGYSLQGGWLPSYRETSGYIVTTLFDLASELADLEYRNRALRIGRWLGQVQNSDGSMSNPLLGENRGIVFDTGQVLQGLVRAFQENGEVELLEAADRAGRWLVEVADKKGHWTRSTHGGIPQTARTR